MRSSYAELLDRLRAALLSPKADLPERTRGDILESRIVDQPLNNFVVRVRANAHTVTQAHIDELKRAGLSEDAIFEATICAAYVAGRERFDIARSLIEGSDAP